MQLVGDSGATDGGPGGTGNLIVGYNEPLIENVRGFPPVYPVANSVTFRV